MKISREDLQSAVSQSLVTEDQAEALWKLLQARRADQPHLDLANVAFYVGALVVISAMTLFLSLVWDKLGGTGIFLTSLVYALGLGGGGLTLWRKTSLKTPGGLLTTIAVCMFPVIAYGLGEEAGFWTFGAADAYGNFGLWIRGSLFLLALCGALAGILALSLVRFPLLVLPTLVFAGVIAFELSHLMLGRPFNGDEPLLVSVWFGLFVLLGSYLLDEHPTAEFVSWGYILGLLALWLGVTLLDGAEMSGRALYGVLNAILILFSVFLERRIFVVLGAVGLFVYLARLASDVFRDSLLFPFVLSLVGIGIVLLGIVYQRYAKSLSAKITQLMPPSMKWIRPRDR